MDSLSATINKEDIQKTTLLQHTLSHTYTSTELWGNLDQFYPLFQEQYGRVVIKRDKKIQSWGISHCKDPGKGKENIIEMMMKTRDGGQQGEEVWSETRDGSSKMGFWFFVWIRGYVFGYCQWSRESENLVFVKYEKRPIGVLQFIFDTFENHFQINITF